MKSKTSFFSREVFTSNLKRFWPVWGLVSFVGLMVPLSILLEYSREGIASLERMTDFYYEFLYGPAPTIAFIYSIIAAMCVWSYLYTSRSVSMYHSMPVSRKALFVSSYLSGIAMILIPYVFGGVFMLLIGALFHCVAFKAALTLVIGVLAETFIFFTLATFCAHIVGSLAALPIVYFFVNFFVPFWEVLVDEILRGFLFGFTGYYEGYTEFFSPLIFFIKKIECINARFEIMPGNYMTYAVGMRNMYILGIYAAVSVLVLFATYLLYKNRRSECAGQVAAFKWVKAVFHSVFTITCALGLGIMFCEILSVGRYSEYRSPVRFGFCMVFAGFLAYYGGHMIMEKTVRVFTKKRTWGAVIYSLIFIAFVTASGMDVMKIRYYHPQTSEVKKLVFYINGTDIDIDPQKNPELYEEFLEVQKSIVDDSELYKLRSMPDMADRYLYFSATFEEKDGTKTERTYDIGLLDSDFEDEASSQSKVKAFVENPELAMLSIEPKEDYKSSYASVNIGIGNYENVFYDSAGSKQGPAPVIEGLKADLLEEKWNLYKNCFEMYSSKTGVIEIQYDRPEENSREEFWQNIYWTNVILTEDMTHTLDALEKVGMGSKEELLEALSKAAYEDGTVYPDTVYYE